MRKVASRVFVAALVMVLVIGCGGKDKDGKSTSKNPAKDKSTGSAKDKNPTAAKDKSTTSAKDKNPSSGKGQATNSAKDKNPTATKDKTQTSGNKKPGTTGDKTKVVKSSGNKPKKSTKRRGTIGVSLLTLQNPFFKVIGDHITTEADKYGYDTLVVSADEDVAKQGNQVTDFITKRCKAIVLSPCDSKSIVPIIQKANEAGIPVFTVDIPCNEKGAEIVCQIATDNYQGGVEAGKAMIEALGEAGGEVAILHYKQAESCILRVDGFTKAIKGHNAKGKGQIKIVVELDGGGARDKGYTAGNDAITAHPNLRGIFAINDPSALGARAALESQGRADQVKIIGFDGQPEGKQAIKDGKIYADPIQYPDQMGIKMVQTFVAHSKGQEVPREILIPTTLYRQADGKKDPDLK